MKCKKKKITFRIVSLYFCCPKLRFLLLAENALWKGYFDWSVKKPLSFVGVLLSFFDKTNMVLSVYVVKSVMYFRIAKSYNRSKSFLVSKSRDDVFDVLRNNVYIVVISDKKYFGHIFNSQIQNASVSEQIIHNNLQ